MTSRNRTSRAAPVETVVIALTAGAGGGFFRVVESKRGRGAGAVGSFRVERYVDENGVPVTEAAYSLQPARFDTLDEALADVAASCPGHTAAPAAFALVPHNLSRDSMRATLKTGGRAFFCNAAGVWIGEMLAFAK